MNAAFTPEREQEILTAAAARCAREGEQLTPLRRRVLSLLLTQSRPAKAYDLLDALKLEHAAAKPPTVYRALEFLVRMGLAHRIESLNAFLACGAGHAHEAPALVLICDGCGAAEEAPAGEVAQAVADAAERRGFSLRTMVVEATGRCGACKEAA